MIVVNLFGGPGTGKSTNAAGLFERMKRKYYNVELVQEYAKELVYEGRFDMLKRQDAMHKEQNKRQTRLKRTVDFCITDSPIIMAIPYVEDDFTSKKFPTATVMRQEMIKNHHSYNNMNFFLKRVKKYVPIGRTQTEEEALEKDRQIIHLLKEQKIHYHEVVADHNCPDRILEIIEAEIRRDIGE